MKIVLWIGSKSNHKALANKVHSLYQVSGIVIEKRREKIRITGDKVLEKIFLPAISSAWKRMISYYDRRYPGYPPVPVCTVENVNSTNSFLFTEELKPDLIIVSGTRIIKEPLLSLAPSIGILNLHTGLSPYVKGGPNATNWCITNNELHLIGSTIMWIDSGIDTGNIVTTEVTEFTGRENLGDIHMKVMEHAHGLYLKAIKMLSRGQTSSVPQASIGTGTTYKTKQWGLKEKFALIKNLKWFNDDINSVEYEKKSKEVKTVQI